MAGFKQLSGLVVPLDAANVDTDAIIPKQFLQAITRVGFGKHLFHEWRYLDVEGTKPNPDFVLNYPQYQGATILLARKNLGCGSSREHAPWALADYGFKVMIAPSFADIFYNNSLNNHMLPIRLSEEEVEEIFQWVWANEGKQIPVDQVFIGSCTNARIEDLRAAAAVMKGRKKADNVKRILVVPGSGLVKEQAEKEGLDKIFIEAGAEWRNPGCSMCLGMNDDRLGEWERCASTSNRNFEGRQGRNGRTHLVSPAMAAAAGMFGKFVDIRDVTLN